MSRPPLREGRALTEGSAAYALVREHRSDDGEEPMCHSRRMWVILEAVTPEHSGQNVVREANSLIRQIKFPEDLLVSKHHALI